MKGKNKNYVGILAEGNTITFVTGLDRSRKNAYWRPGEKASPFPMRVAAELSFGLNANGYRAMVLTAPEGMELMNPAEEEEK